MDVIKRTFPDQDIDNFTRDDWYLRPMLEVEVSSAKEVDGALTEAIAVITEAAIHHQTGILVTRTGAGRYIVRAHSGVPYGLIQQQYA